MSESVIMDALDRSIVRALQIAPRAPFSLLGEVLDVSEQTAARRYRRLRRDGLLKVTAVINPDALGEGTWTVRVQCRPSGASSLAQALAQRDDVGWVSIGAGGTEVLCVVRSRTAEAREDLLLQRLPRTTQVLGMSAYLTLHPFVSGGPARTAGDGGVGDWTGLAAELTPSQEAALLATLADEPDVRTPDGPVTLDAGDLAMLELLVADGRSGWASIAQAGGLSEGRAARRLRELRALDVYHLDIDLVARSLGFAAQANFWLTVLPAALDRVGRALGELPEVNFAAAISGAHNVMVVASCRDFADLYRFAAEGIGALDGITAMEIAPVIRVVKQAGTLMVDGRLVV